MSDLQSACKQYLKDRVSDYEFRKIRFRAVAQVLQTLGFGQYSSLVDIGAGRQDFERYLREEHGWCGLYEPIDGSIDGTDLNLWTPNHKYDFACAIEVIEHVRLPNLLLQIGQEYTKCGAVYTTPNCYSVDVIGCDPTHIALVTPEHFIRSGWRVREASLFKLPADSLVAWWSRL